MSFNTNSAAPKEFHMKTGQCCNDPALCCYASCCPCFAMKEVASNVGNDNGWIHCLATFPFNLGCCSLTMLGQEVALKHDIPMTTAESACNSCFGSCTCYSCKVLHESRLHKREEAVGAVAEWQSMQDRGAATDRTTEMV